MSGRALRDAALDQVARHADPAWCDAAHAAVARCARVFREFTTDEVWGLIAGSGQRTHERRALGPIMVAAVKRGLIEKVGYRTSNDPICHCRPKQAYRRIASPT